MAGLAAAAAQLLCALLTAGGGAVLADSAEGGLPVVSAELTFDLNGQERFCVTEAFVAGQQLTFVARFQDDIDWTVRLSVTRAGEPQPAATYASDKSIWHSENVTDDGERTFCLRNGHFMNPVRTTVTLFAIKPEDRHAYRERENSRIDAQDTAGALRHILKGLSSDVRSMHLRMRESHVHKTFAHRKIAAVQRHVDRMSTVYACVLAVTAFAQVAFIKRIFYADETVKHRGVSNARV